MFKRLVCRFTRTASIMDLRVTALDQLIADRKRRTRRYEVLNHTAGIRSVFA